jgi:cytochrome c553
MTSQIALASTVIMTAAALAAASTLASRPARATQAMAQQTKLGCAACHRMPPTKDKLTPRGEQFKETGK